MLTDCYYIKTIKIKLMKNFFSIFYLGGLYAYVFKDLSNINLIYFVMLIIFSFYTLVSIITLTVHKKNPNFMDDELHEQLSSILEREENHPTISKMNKIMMSVYYIFFCLSLIIVPLYKISFFMAFVLILHALFMFFTIYYYIIIKEKVYKIKIDFKDKYKSELEVINNYNEKNKDEN